LVKELANSETTGMEISCPFLLETLLLETFSTTDRLASFFGLATCTSLLLVLLEKVLLSSSFPGEARPKPPPGRGMTEGKDREDYQRVR
jgi:hypothetical protein